jgi:hypothetical protein
MAGNYPSRIRKLEPCDGRFDAYRLRANAADEIEFWFKAGS